jgi:hypothetical protein
MLSKKITSICLMVCLVCISSATRVSAAEAHQQSGTDLLKQKVELFGVGANVNVKLMDGRKMKGSISSIIGAGFTLAPEPGGLTRPINYEEISELKLATRKYEASGVPDASEARRVIAALGTGKHVMVRTASLKIHGQITSIEPDHFVILPDDQKNPVQIAYQDVQQVGKNLGILSMIGLVTVIVVVIIVIAKLK